MEKLRFISLAVLGLLTVACSSDDATSAEQKDEKAPEEPKSVETPTESKE